jgi:hypothetical protein
MRRNVVTLLLCACVLASCQNRTESPAAPHPRVRTTYIPESEKGKVGNIIARPLMAVIDKVVVGTELGSDGNVAAENTVAIPGQPIYITLRLRDSPVGLSTGAIWYDPAGRKLAEERKAMNGAKVATFAMTRKLTPGTYRVEGYWGGNLAGDKRFDVVAKTKKAK